MTDIVQDGKVVSLAYTLRLTNGEVIDFSDANEPLEYLHGAANIVPGLERALTGLQIGQSKEVEVAPADGYGAYDPEEVEVVEREQLPKEFPLELGMTLAVSDDEGNLEEAYVREIGPNSVTLDYNHPLAGQALLFSVEVVDVREATAEELEHGHPHGLEEEDYEDEDDDFDDLLDYDDDEDLEDEEDYEDEEDDELLN